MASGEAGTAQSEAPAVQAQEVDPYALRVRDPPIRIALQVAGAIVALLLFIFLILALRSTTAGTVTSVGLVAGLAVVLLLEILLLEPIYARVFRRVPRSLPLTPDEDNYIVGCPGCGTVFTVVEADLDGGSFSCHNCGRPGYIKDHNLNRGAIKEEQCRTCGNTYLEYLEHSECPVCHTFNAY